ncbi:MAG: hypothetical protein JW951_01985 [Lentisphaerae bacterium]|nr:hypothetical protein [Lentisphaerota bacterium]
MARRRMHPQAAAAVCAALLVLFSYAAAPPGPPPADITLSASPQRVHLDRDLVLTIRVEAPCGVHVALPPLDGRLDGFLLNGVYDEEPERTDGHTVWERRARLTPLLSETYRLAPLAVRVTDRRVDPPRVSWTRAGPLAFELVPPVDGDPGADVQTGLDPVWIAPAFRTVLFYVLAALAGAAVLILGGRLLRRLHRRAVLARLSPRERALRALDALLRETGPSPNRLKEFYIALTRIVRRYIEAQHGIRAPEQTTEEFLAAARRNPDFSPAVLDRLGRFLEAADLVKFAAHRPDPAAVSQAVATARAYIELDTAPAPPGAAPQAPENTAARHRKGGTHV